MSAAPPPCRRGKLGFVVSLGVMCRRCCCGRWRRLPWSGWGCWRRCARCPWRRWWGRTSWSCWLPTPPPCASSRRACSPRSSWVWRRPSGCGPASAPGRRARRACHARRARPRGGASTRGWARVTGPRATPPRRPLCRCWLPPQPARRPSRPTRSKPLLQQQGLEPRGPQAGEAAAGANRVHAGTAARTSIGSSPAARQRCSVAMARRRK